MIATPPGREGDVAAAVDPVRGALELEIVAGGESRAESVAAALGCVDSELVAIHDAARPLVTAELVDAVLTMLADHSEAAGVIAAAPVTDTIKRGDAARGKAGAGSEPPFAIAATEDRDLLWAAQTPQAFRAASLRDAYAADRARVAAATNEAMLLEQVRATVLLYPAPAENLKVTTPVDLRLAELLLAQRSG